MELRDRTLVQAQNQLDEFAANMASALSDRENDGVAATVGLATGFDVDIGTPALQNGNQITLDYTNSTTGFQGRYTFIMASNAATATAINGAGLSATDNQVFGIDASGGPPRSRRRSARSSARASRSRTPSARPCASSTTAPATRATSTG